MMQHSAVFVSPRGSTTMQVVVFRDERIGGPGSSYKLLEKPARFRNSHKLILGWLTLLEIIFCRPLFFFLRSVEFLEGD